MSADPRAAACLELLYSAGAGRSMMVQAIEAADCFRDRTPLNPALRGYVGYEKITSEISRRNSGDESGRFAPLFDAFHADAYPSLGLIYPTIKEGSELRRVLGSLALGLRLTADFADAVASSLSTIVQPLLGSLDLECPGGSVNERTATLLRLHAQMPGGRTSSGSVVGRSGDD